MRPRIFLLFVTFSILALGPATELFGGDLETAVEHAAAGRYDEAVQVLETALAAADSTEAQAPLEAALGRVLVDTGETYAALQHLQAATEHRGTPHDHLALADALLSIARRNAASGTGRWIQIVPYLEDAIREAKETEGDAASRDQRLAVIGEAHYWMGEPEAAVAAWDQLGSDDLPGAEFARIADLHARALHGLARYDDAAAAFARAENPRGVASALAAARRGAEAVAIYAQLLQAAPGDEVLLQEAVAAARYAGAQTDLAGALADLEVEGAARAPVLIARALLAESSGAPEAAERLVRKATQANPNSPRAWYELGRLQLVSAGGLDDRLDAALAALVKALELAPTDQALIALLWDLAGRDYALLWRSPPAAERSLTAQRALVAATPDDELAWANLGNTLRVTGYLDEAVEAYDRAMAIEDEDPSILSDRGLALSGRGDVGPALEAFEAAVRADPDFDAAHQNAFRQHWLAGRDEDAARHLAEAERRTRAAGGNWVRYRFLLDRVYRTGRRPDVR